jgi:serine/threonine protein kinase HipA of HipAB toxin-antitoxin module
MTRELQDICILQPQHLLEAPPNRHQRLLALLRRASLAIPIGGNSLTNRPRPDTDSVKALADIDHDAHDFVVTFVLQSFADGGELSVQPELVDGDAALVAEGIGPFAAVLVLLVFPFRTDALLEEVVVGLEA